MAVSTNSRASRLKLLSFFSACKRKKKKNNDYRIYRGVSATGLESHFVQGGVLDQILERFWVEIIGINHATLLRCGDGKGTHPSKHVHCNRKGCSGWCQRARQGFFRRLRTISPFLNKVTRRSCSVWSLEFQYTWEKSNLKAQPLSL